MENATPKKSETGPVSSVKGNRRWIAGFVWDLVDAVETHPNLAVEVKSQLIGGLRAMFVVLKNLAKHHVPITSDRKVVENPSRPPRELVDNDGNVTHLEIPVTPIVTLIVPIVNDLSNHLTDFNEKNNIPPRV
ncbi:MAG TPA: hypothetical protein PKD00_10330 [Burkholderiales bacterium]|nr:hypothetical protein [Burkholderiales bacterium]